MRTYRHNSPQAAARIVALAMLADGDPSAGELAAAERQDLYRRLGLDPGEWQRVMHACCEDLQVTPHLAWDTCYRLDERTLAQILAEVEDPRLRLAVLTLCCAVVNADGRVTDGEWVLLAATLEQWSLQRAMLRAVR